MTRWPAVLALAAAVTTTGCRTNCGSLASHARQPAPCTLVGSGGRPVTEGCFDAVTGAPIPCPPSAGVMPGGGYPVLPGPAPGFNPGAPANELPFPAPSDLIPPRSDVPFAPPTPAPGDGLGAGLRGGVPAKK
jgi:hypothetical protein